MKPESGASHGDPNQYERPNQKWVCGWACEGKACRIGPDPSGRCRATFECTPAFEVKEGETKGRYRCTRPKEYGGPCAEGPGPTGQCGRPIEKCQPARTLRAMRGAFTRVVVAATIGFLLVTLFGDYRHEFVNPGKISFQHNTAAFAKIHGTGGNSDQGCSACHDTARKSTRDWVQAAFQADPGPLEVWKFWGSVKTDFHAIDQNCQKCHTSHNFHQPNVVRNHSCSLCHQEHKGGGLMQPPTDKQCLSCHGSQEVMTASAEKGKKLQASDFQFRPQRGRVVFAAPRPASGYTTAFRSFDQDHPEFQVVRERLKETNTLRFNHQRHFANDIPSLNGKKLECVTCHQPEASGLYHQKVSFEKHCQACHSLQFDPRNPELAVPHGRPDQVRAFLRSLPLQYSDLARAKKLPASETEAFVQKQLVALREQARTGEDLEQQVFFNSERYGPVPITSVLPDKGRSRYPGCAYCHEVKPKGGVVPEVTAPAQPDRFLIRGGFDHSKHFHMNCADCHQAEKSSLTADILLPSKASCAECHGHKGGVRAGCATCHSFHTTRDKKMDVARP